MKKCLIPRTLAARIGICLVSLLALAAVVASPAAQAQEEREGMPTTSITIHDTSFQTPRHLLAGFNDLTFVNAGSIPHEGGLFRMNPGVTEAEVLQSLQDFNTVVTLGAFAGGTNGLAPGTRQEVILHLKSGNYLLIDPGAMLVQQLSVVPRDDDGHTAVLRSYGTAFLIGPLDKTPPFAIALPGSIGRHETLTIKVRNIGTQTHEFSLNRLPPGVSVATALSCFGATPDPSCGALQNELTPAGGMAAIAPDTTAWLVLHLEPGNYIVACFMPDTRFPAGPDQPVHVFEGMNAGFTVQG